MSKRPLVIPSASLEWEVWRWRRGEAVMERTVADPALAGEEPIGIGLSAGELLLLAFWLNTRDATLFEGLILSQLEKRGLVSRSGATPPIFDDYAVAEEEGRTLVRVALLPVNFPANLSLSRALYYASVSDLLPLPTNRLIIWPERQHLVVTATFGEEAVYQQVLVRRGSTLSAGVVAELRALRLGLEAEGIVRQIEGITLWHAPDQPVTGGECLAALGLPVLEEERPAPSGPRVERASSRARLIPAPVQAARRAKGRKERLVRYAAIAAAFYVGLAFVLWAWQLQLKRTAAAMGREVGQDQPSAATLEKTAAAWRTLEPAMDPRFYALEQFHQVSAVLPPVGIRFTLFELKGDVITIRGTARNAPEVFKYVEALRQHRELPRYHWRVGQPRVLKDDTAEFRIEGKRG